MMYICSRAIFFIYHPLTHNLTTEIFKLENTNLFSHKMASSLLLLLAIVVMVSECCRPPVVFNMGDSNSDTGAIGALFGNHLHYPYGRTFFNRPTGRLCDGRLIIDFYADHLKIDYLTPYLESLNPNFKSGANFALSGSSAIGGDIYPYSLKFQVLEFSRFYNRSLQLRMDGHKNLLEVDDFRNALYMFDIGQNDLKHQFDITTNYSQILRKIPAFIANIREEIQEVYGHGGRKFWIHNTGPLGCLPGILSNMKPNSSQVDEYGCVELVNQAAQEFNSQLYVLCEDLRSQLQNSTIVYVDLFAIKYNLIANSSSYGFEKPFMACCGYGGPPYNLDPSITCDDDRRNLCGDGKHISWDGFHYTDAANSFVSSMILSTNYSSPPLPLDFFCANSATLRFKFSIMFVSRLIMLFVYAIA